MNLSLTVATLCYYHWRLSVRPNAVQSEYFHSIQSRNVNKFDWPCGLSPSENSIRWLHLKMAGAGIPIESLDKDQLKTVRLLCEIWKNTWIPILTSLLWFSCYSFDLFRFQFSDFLQSYNKLSEICFTDCVNDFTSRDIKKAEVCFSTKCVSVAPFISSNYDWLFFFLIWLFHPSSKQDLCALNCMEKYLKMNQRISQRFQEFQILANENAIAMAQRSGK